MFGCVYSGSVHGINAFLVSVESDISDGFPGFDLVGFLGSEVKESKERVLTAIKNSSKAIPMKKITINLSPANIRKRGTGFDLSIAISLLVAAGEINKENTDGCLICGELMLSGDICGIRGVLPIVKLAKEKGIKRCIIPKENADEAAVIEDIDIIPVTSLSELIQYLNGEVQISPAVKTTLDIMRQNVKPECDFKDVQGQLVAKRGLEIAAAGLHNVLMIGPPGTGKTMLAKCLPGILPPLTKDECLEVSSIYSVAGLLNASRRMVTERPVVSVHHSVTSTALAGGGNSPKPGLITLSHRGVLFLDEIPEFSKNALEVLRQPLEDKVIHIVRNNYMCDYPANFMLVGAMNPCPCGMYPDLTKCSCTDVKRRNYIGKLSKPLIDRIDICMTVSRPSSNDILNKKKQETSEDVRKRVIEAQKIQQQRFLGSKIFFNSQMGVDEVDRFCRLGASEKDFMENAFMKYELSARGYHRILKCARTIADLDYSESITTKHLAEALFYKTDIM